MAAAGGGRSGSDGLRQAARQLAEESRWARPELSTEAEPSAGAAPSSTLVYCGRLASALRGLEAEEHGPALQVLREFFGSEEALGLRLCDMLQVEVNSLLAVGRPADERAMAVVADLLGVLLGLELQPGHVEPRQGTPVLQRLLEFLLAGIQRSSEDVQEHLQPLHDLALRPSLLPRAPEALLELVADRVPGLCVDSTSNGLSAGAETLGNVPPVECLFSLGCLAQEIIDSFPAGEPCCPRDVQGLRRLQQAAYDMIKAAAPQFGAQAAAAPEAGKPGDAPGEPCRADSDVAAGSSGSYVISTRLRRKSRVVDGVPAPPPTIARSGGAAAPAVELREPEPTERLAGLRSEWRQLGRRPEPRSRSAAAEPAGPSCPAASSAAVAAGEGDAVGGEDLDALESLAHRQVLPSALALLRVQAEAAGGAALLCAQLAELAEKEVTSLARQCSERGVDVDLDPLHEKIRLISCLLNGYLSVLGREEGLGGFAAGYVRCVLRSAELPPRARRLVRPVLDVVLSPPLVHHAASELWRLVRASCGPGAAETMAPIRVYAAGSLAREIEISLSESGVDGRASLEETMRCLQWAVHFHLSWTKAATYVPIMDDQEEAGEASPSACADEPEGGEEATTAGARPPGWRAHHMARRQRSPSRSGLRAPSASGSKEDDEADDVASEGYASEDISSLASHVSEEDALDEISDLEDFIDFSPQFNSFGFLNQLEPCPSQTTREGAAGALEGASTAGVTQDAERVAPDDGVPEACATVRDYCSTPSRIRLDWQEHCGQLLQQLGPGPRGRARGRPPAAGERPRKRARRRQDAGVGAR